MGAGSGGGGSSGKVDYPTYLKHVHAEWLAGIGDPSDPEDYHDLLTTSMTEAMEMALSSNPFSSFVVYDPDTVLGNIDTQVATVLALNFSTLFSSYDRRIVGTAESTFSPTTDYATLLAVVKAGVDSELYSTTEVDADIVAFGALLDDQIDSTVLPRFRRGMQDLNAVMSSAFVIGAALIEEGRTKEVTKYGSALRLQNYSQRIQLVAPSTISLIQAKLQALTSDGDLAYRMTVSELEFRRAVTALLLDAKRTRLAAKKEELEQELSLTDTEARWELSVFQHGANLLASVAGGTSLTDKKAPMWQSVLGGVMSGAAAGGQAGGGYGALAGGIIGGIGGYLSSQD